MFYHFEDDEKRCFYECDLWTLFTEEDLDSIYLSA